MFCDNCGAQLSEGASFCPTCGHRLTPAQPAANIGAPGAASGPSFFPAPPPMMTDMNYATWATRALGYIVDFVLVMILMGVLYGMLGGMLGAMAGLGGDRMASPICCFSAILFPLSTILVGLYNKVYLIAQRGYSIGQGIVHIRVVDAQGKLLTQSSALIRLLVQAAFGLVPFLPLLDMLWPLWDPRRQTLHDKAVNCYVINDATVVL